MADDAPGIPCFINGTVRAVSGEPIGGTTLDLRQADGEGLYEDQPDVNGPWMRGFVLGLTVPMSSARWPRSAILSRWPAPLAS